jgi:predicted double-glycine peptidase
MLTTLAAALSSLALTVPYLSQTDALCGGAAAAMVFRYWGDAHADIEQFKPLVDKRAGGIANDVLVRAIEERGWHATVGAGSIDELTAQIESKHPVVILVADRGPLNHYLVVTGIESDAVIVHDPAWGPSRRLPTAALVRMWRPTNFWSLVIVPGERHDRAAATVEPAMTTGELGKVAAQRFADHQWREAADFAERAVAADPADRYAWELLAASRFVQDDVDGALGAWNRIGKPRIDLVTIDGLAHTRFQTIAATMGLRPNMLLTPDAFRRAERRLRDLPGDAAASLTLRPGLDGYVTVRARLAERGGPPRGAAAWTVAALQTAIDREVRATLPGSTGQGEVWSASWRWWDGRPRVAIGFAAPHVGHLPGIWRVDASWTSQTYRIDADAPDATPRSEDQSQLHGALTFSDWLTGSLRYSATVGVDSWKGSINEGRTLFAGGALERHWQADRWMLRFNGTTWTHPSEGSAFRTAGVRAAFQSAPPRSSQKWVYLADAGLAVATSDAPLAIWAGAGEGRAREPLMRAHPLLNGGAIDLTSATVFGRTLDDMHAEAQRWIASATPVRFGAAAFADVARASGRLAPASSSVAQADVGGGLRLGIPGAAGVLRVDIAHGLRDGADALTIGWQYQPISSRLVP